VLDQKRALLYVRRGIHTSRARFVGYMDADLATPIVVTKLVPHKQLHLLVELTNPDRRQLIADQCRRWARRFSWDACAERLARVLLSEVARKDQGCPLRRDGVDLTTVASWPPGQVDGDVERRLQKALRVTDLISKGPDGLRVLLVGCDEVGAARALERVPVQPSRLRLATTTQVLCGIGEDHLP
jgi:hypothetical protein